MTRSQQHGQGYQDNEYEMTRSSQHHLGYQDKSDTGVRSLILG